MFLILEEPVELDTSPGSLPTPPANKPLENYTPAAEKIKEKFKSAIAKEIVTVLNPHRRRDCKQGKIKNNEDFKHLAKKVSLKGYFFQNMWVFYGELFCGDGKSNF